MLFPCLPYKWQHVNVIKILTLSYGKNMNSKKKM